MSANIHTIATLTSRPEPQPSSARFPVTVKYDDSPFKDVQSGKTRAVLPTFGTIQEEQQYRKEHLVLTFRAMHRAGLAEGIAGHCSVRDPVDPKTFWINPQARSFGRMRISDLVRVNEAGEVVEGSAPVDASATSIHAPIYRKRGRGPRQHGGSQSGVEAIVHVHGPHSKAFSCLNRQLDRINQDVCAFDGCTVLVPFGGAVFDLFEGERIAGFLHADTKVALLQNHGALSVGKTSIDEAAWWQLNYEMCCKAQLLVDASSGRITNPDGTTSLPPHVVRVGDEECRSTKAEMGSAEMGWYSMSPYIEDELWASQGDHLM